MNSRLSPFSRLAACAIVLLAASVAAAAAGLTASPAPETQVMASTANGAASIGPGMEFPLGLLLRIEPGWRIFWLNPGEAGYPTDVRIEAPDGFRVGNLLWPTPIQFKQPSGRRGNGYEHEVLLAALVRTPEDLEVGQSVEFTVSAKWLVCKEVCRPGGVSLRVSLPTEAEGRKMNRRLFEAWEQRLPLPADSAERPFTAELTGGLGGPMKLMLTWKDAAPASVEWFPANDPTTELTHEQVTSSGKTTTIQFNARTTGGKRPVGGRLLSLVVWDDSGGARRGAWVSSPIK